MEELFIGYAFLKAENLRLYNEEKLEKPYIGNLDKIPVKTSVLIKPEASIYQIVEHKFYLLNDIPVYLLTEEFYTKADPYLIYEVSEVNFNENVLVTDKFTAEAYYALHSTELEILELLWSQVKNNAELYTKRK